MFRSGKKGSRLSSKKLNILMGILFLSILMTAAVRSPQALGMEQLETGGGVYNFAANGRIIPVYYYKPENYTKSSPVVFVMHGMKRRAGKYRNTWKKHAEKYSLLIIAPKFSDEDFPGGRCYNRGNVMTKNKKNNPRNLWTFSIIDKIFDDLPNRIVNTNSKFYMFGHSAGGQFVHRYVIFNPQAPIEKAVAANAGWYAAPDFDIKFPYGLKNAPVTEWQLKMALKKPLVILLGEKDNDPNHKSLKRSKGAVKQGRHRLARGQYFIKKAIGEAGKLGLETAWQVKYVPNAGHNHRKMSRAAARLLFSGRKKK